MSEPSLLITHGGLLVGALVITALLGLILQVRNQRRLINSQLQHMEDLQGAVAAYGQSLIASRTLLEQMENRLADFTERNLEIQSQFAFNRSFEEASRLVKDGTTVESLVTDCGLSNAEAALMIRLHQRDGKRPRQQWRQSAGSEPPTAAESTESPEPAMTSESMTSEEVRLKESLLAAHSR